jgi:DnaJ family protein C protein 8
MERLDRMLMEAAARAAEAGPSRAVDGSAPPGGDVPDDASVAEQILTHIAGGDIFSALNLPKPTCDDAGRPVWDVTESEISKAFRKRSLVVHPDKNPSADAKQAFDKLNDAIRVLRDPIKKGDALRKFARSAFAEKCRLDPTLTERAKKAQEKIDATVYASDIALQQREHRQRVEAARMKQRLARARQRGSDDEAALLEPSSDDEDDAKPKVDTTAKRKRVGRGKDEASSDSDSAGLARPVLGTRGGRGRGRGRGGVRFI